jgi:hypothetical protein
MMTMRWTEAEIEAAIVKRPHLLYGSHLKPERFRAFSQVRLGEAGIADIVIVHPHGFDVVECKRDAADERTIGQVLRYAGAMNAVVQGDPEFAFALDGTPDHPGSDYFQRERASGDDFPLVGAICVAPTWSSSVEWAAEFGSSSSHRIRFVDWNGGKPINTFGCDRRRDVPAATVSKLATAARELWVHDDAGLF